MSDAYENDEPHGRNTGAKKDIWTKLSAIGGVSTAVMVALIGSIGSCVLKDQQVQSNRVQLYTELMSKREDSENALRKDMFKQILTSFLTEEAGGECPLTRIDKMLLNLELISRNFHETLDIRPLFFHVLQKIVSEIPNLDKPSCCAGQNDDHTPVKSNRQKQDAEDKESICESQLSISLQRKARSQNKSGEELTWSVKSNQKQGAEDKESICESQLCDLWRLKARRQNKSGEELTWEEWKKSLKKERLNQLIKIAKRISRKQMESLSGMEKRIRMTVNLPKTCRDVSPLEESAPCFEKPQTKTRNLVLQEGCSRTFKISVSRSYPRWHRVLIRVETDKTSEEIASDRDGPKSNVSEFWVGHFRFPLVDNTFLSEKERYAVILDDLDEEEQTAKISLLYFPATLAGLKEKSFYQQRMINTLLKQETLFVPK